MAITLGGALVFLLIISEYCAIQTDVTWEPKQPVESVVIAGKGGDADKLTRFI
jgi:tripartite-type tricarboxylate transporter receptor subunit TctC